MPPFYLQDISTILHFEIYSEEQSQQLSDEEYDLKQKISKHTGTLDNLQDEITRLPLEVVQVSIDEIERMSQRARQANQALDFLVDLKQKQSDVLDARSARIQAEESLKVTKENERQGKTMKVFTVVTIIFKQLPLSFLAAFFAINIAQFHRDAAGYLVLVSISATITAVLVYVAFKAHAKITQLQPTLEKSWTWMKRPAKGGNKLPVEEEGSGYKLKKALTERVGLVSLTAEPHNAV
ncbi:hypothetical protein V8E51_013713 [Hyaloscypha variabilis]